MFNRSFWIIFIIYFNNCFHLLGKRSIPRSKKCRSFWIRLRDARPHVERRVVESIVNKGWDLLPHPFYYPTEAPTLTAR